VVSTHDTHLIKDCSDVALENAAAAASPFPLNHCEPQTIRFSEVHLKLRQLGDTMSKDRRKLTGSPVSPSGKLPFAILGAAGGYRLASTPVRPVTGHTSLGSYTTFHLDKSTYDPDS
jgi:hypothetical protein